MAPDVSLEVSSSETARTRLSNGSSAMTPDTLVEATPERVIVLPGEAVRRTDGTVCWNRTFPFTVSPAVYSLSSERSNTMSSWGTLGMVDVVVSLVKYGQGE